jgi:dephospho-CoA kinase
MPVIGITGGVASGKSQAITLLQRHFSDARWFSADHAVSELYAGSPEVARELEALFGKAAVTPKGVDRDWIRQRVFREPELRSALNAVLHPRVRALWSQAAGEARQSKRWFFAEIPLLYETDGQTLCDHVVVVGCTVQTQIKRMTRERGLSETVAHQILEAQWSTGRKVLLGDFLLWNDAPLPCLQRQVDLLTLWLQNAYA